VRGNPAHRRAVETIGDGEVLVIDARGDAGLSDVYPPDEKTQAEYRAWLQRRKP